MERIQQHYMKHVYIAHGILKYNIPWNIFLWNTEKSTKQFKELKLLMKGCERRVEKATIVNWTKGIIVMEFKMQNNNKGQKQSGRTFKAQEFVHKFDSYYVEIVHKMCEDSLRSYINCSIS